MAVFVSGRQEVAVTASDEPLVDALCDALEKNGRRLSLLLRHVPDPRPIAVGTWTIGETANHVAGSGHYFLAVGRGEVEPESLKDVDAANARDLAADPERDLHVLAQRAVDGDNALVAHARQIVGDPPVTLFAGATVPFSTLLGVELGEVLVHGWDIARAARLPWPIAPEHAALALQAYLPLLPHMLDCERAEGVRLTIELRVRGTAAVVARISDSTLQVEEPTGQRVDCRLTVDPVAYLLLTWNRISPLGAIARGQLIPWGRKPWRVTQFGTLLAT